MQSKNEQISVLIDMNEEHELLLDTIAHDIKNSLLSPRLTVEMLKNLPQEKQEKNPVLVEHIQNSLKHLDEVINELVASRWQKYRYQGKLELLDLHKIIEDVKQTLATQILERNAVINQEMEISQFTFVKRKMRSVIYNLLHNAIKYTSETRRPEILIRCYQESDWLVLSVADNGIGISKADQELIFEKFRQVKTTSEGSGVGLYLVNTIVASAGGKIIIDSEPDKGSVFKVYLKQSLTLNKRSSVNQDN